MPVIRNPDGLSKRQQNILQFIGRFSREHARPPTIREIGSAVGISSTSVVNYNLNRLETLGLILRNKEVSRGIRLTDDGMRRGGVAPEPATTSRNMVQIPLLGRIAAGEPIRVPGTDFPLFDEESALSLTRDLIGDERGVFALQVRGNSMIDALINDGDIVILRQVDHVANGDMVAAWLTDREETTLKRFFLEGNQVRLQPANPFMGPIFADPAHVQVQGKVVLVVRQVA